MSRFQCFHNAVNEQIKLLTAKQDNGPLGVAEPLDEILDRSETVYVAISGEDAVNVNLMIYVYKIVQHIKSALLVFVCLFNWGFSSNSKIFHSHGNVTIAGEGLQILTCARHSWSLSSEGSLPCHIYCDTGQPFIMVISEDP